MVANNRRTNKEYERLISVIDWSIQNFSKLYELSPRLQIYNVLSFRVENGKRHSDIVARSVVLTESERQAWRDAGYIVQELCYPEQKSSQFNALMRHGRYLMQKRSIFLHCIKIQYLPESIIAAYVITNPNTLGGSNGGVDPLKIMEMHEEYTLQQSLFNNLETEQDVANYVNWLYDSFKKTEQYQKVMDHMNFKYVTNSGNHHGYPLSERAYRDAIKFKEQVDTQAK